MITIKRRTIFPLEDGVTLTPDETGLPVSDGTDEDEMRKVHCGPSEDDIWEEHYGEAVREAIASGKIKSPEEFDYTPKLYLCTKKDGFNIIISLYGGDNQPLPFARVFDLNENLIGAFDINIAKPTKESDIIGVKESEFGILTSDVKKKIVEWVDSEYEYIPDCWYPFVSYWRDLNKNASICFTCDESKSQKARTCFYCEKGKKL